METLPDKQSPVWLGLPGNAETMLLRQQAAELVIKLLRMQQIDDEDGDADVEIGTKSRQKKTSVSGEYFYGFKWEQPFFLK